MDLVDLKLTLFSLEQISYNLLVMKSSVNSFTGTSGHCMLFNLFFSLFVILKKLFRLQYIVWIWLLVSFIALVCSLLTVVITCCFCSHHLFTEPVYHTNPVKQIIKLLRFTAQHNNQIIVSVLILQDVYCHYWPYIVKTILTVISLLLLLVSHWYKYR